MYIKNIQFIYIYFVISNCGMIFWNYVPILKLFIYIFYFFIMSIDMTLKMFYFIKCSWNEVEHSSMKATNRLIQYPYELIYARYFFLVFFFFFFFCNRLIRIKFFFIIFKSYGNIFKNYCHHDCVCMWLRQNWDKLIVLCFLTKIN